MLLEIGPGLGALTYSLLPCIQHLFAIEIDRDLAAQLYTDQQTSLFLCKMHFDFDF